MFIQQRPIDRQDHLRKDEAAIAALWQDPKARVLPVHNGACLINYDQDVLSLAAFRVQAPWQVSDAIYLGTDGETPWFTLAIDDEEANDLVLPTGTEFTDLRKVGMRLNANDGALLTYAKGLCFWHENTTHCSHCGGQLKNLQAGHTKRCVNEACGHMVFPRTDPAVIMLVTHTDDEGAERCLLGRSPAWPAGMYSTLAGFVECGESLEQAVAREVFEEAGVRVHDVQYITSQPWPFPRSIMLGFKATATTTELDIDTHEIEDAQWFTRAQIKEFGTWGDPAYRYQMPRTDSIAYYLISRWLNNAGADN